MNELELRTLDTKQFVSDYIYLLIQNEMIEEAINASLNYLPIGYVYLGEIYIVKSNPKQAVEYTSKALECQFKLPWQFQVNVPIF